MASAVVFGAYGTFGSHVARELARLGVSVVVAGRDVSRAQALARELGPEHRGLKADVTRADSCRAALDGEAVAVNCAGPFADLGPALLDASLEAGCHYADIADDRSYAARVRSYGERFRERGLCAAYGCSSLPSISGALGLLALQDATAIPNGARVTLFIGNKNPKGTAAIRSALGILGKRIQTPQGLLEGFRDREAVRLPEPFGRRAVVNFESPDYDLFPKLFGVRSVSVKVGFELAVTTWAFTLLAGLPPQFGGGVTSFLRCVGRLQRGLGSSGGAVMTELFFTDGSVRRAAMVARKAGQRMAALPCAYTVHALCHGMTRAWGAVTAYDVLGADSLLERLVADGFELHKCGGQKAEG